MLLLRNFSQLMVAVADVAVTTMNVAMNVDVVVTTAAVAVMIVIVVTIATVQTNVTADANKNRTQKSLNIQA